MSYPFYFNYTQGRRNKCGYKTIAGLLKLKLVQHRVQVVPFYTRNEHTCLISTPSNIDS